MEQMLEAMPPSGARERERGERDSGSGTPDGSTPTRRRRPATRSQSARVSGGNKSIRRRAAAQGNDKTAGMGISNLFVAQVGFYNPIETCI